MEYRRTKSAMPVMTTIRMAQRDRDLWYVAAKREGVSQAEFLRSAIREKAQRGLADEAASR